MTFLRHLCLELVDFAPWYGAILGASLPVVGFLAALAGYYLPGVWLLAPTAMLQMHFDLPDAQPLIRHLAIGVLLYPLLGTLLGLALRALGHAAGLSRGGNENP